MVVGCYGTNSLELSSARLVRVVRFFAWEVMATTTRFFGGGAALKTVGTRWLADWNRGCGRWFAGDGQW